MKKIENAANISAEIANHLATIPDAEKPTAWDKSKRKAITDFKTAVLADGLRNQDNRCGWCTLLIGSLGRRTAHRDHIAPKSRYPQWTFLPKNLALACEYCNGFAVKSDLDTVFVLNVLYENTQFSVVHPYLDEPDEHLSFSQIPGGVGVTISGLSPKGLWTIEHLKLDDPGMTVQRAQDVLYLQALGTLPTHYQQLLSQALTSVTP